MAINNDPYANDVLDPSHTHMMSIDGVATRYFEFGQGPPLVMFHGGHFGSLYSLDAFSLNLYALATRYRVIAIDKLGQGMTNGPAGADYTYDAVVRHAAAALEALGVQDAHLLGHSRGGMLVASLARRPDLSIRSAVIVSSGTLAPDNEAAPPGAFYAALPTVEGPPSERSVRIEPDAQAVRPGAVTHDFVQRMLAIARRPQFAAVVDQMAASGTRVFQDSLQKARKAELQSIKDHGLPVPTLILWGDSDKSAPLDSAYQLYEIVRQRTTTSELHILGQCGHYLFREDPAAFNNTVGAFCR